MKLNNCNNVSFNANVKFVYYSGFKHFYDSKTVLEQLTKIKNDKFNQDVLLEPVAPGRDGPGGISVRVMNSGKNTLAKAFAESKEVLYDNGILKAYKEALEHLKTKDWLWSKEIPQDLLTKDFLI